MSNAKVETIVQAILPYIVLAAGVVFLTYGCGLIVQFVLGRVTKSYRPSEHVKFKSWDGVVDGIVANGPLAVPIGPVGGGIAIVV